MPGAAVVLEVAGNKQPAFAAGADGRFVIRGVRLATYTLRIAFPGLTDNPYVGAPSIA